MTGTRHDPRRGGFTLVELVVVVLVIALLAALAQPNLQRAITKARATEAVADLQVVRVALLNYHADHHVYPADVNRGKVPSGLGPYMPTGFSLVQKYYTVDYDNWTQQPQGFVGLTIITTDTIIGNEMVRMLRPNAWSNGSNKFTWVVEWTK
jgi:prepilin-type N-terminal cleavage/methylation domain-containing protein